MNDPRKTIDADGIYNGIEMFKKSLKIEDFKISEYIKLWIFESILSMMFLYLYEKFENYILEVPFDEIFSEKENLKKHIGRRLAARVLKSWIRVEVDLTVQIGLNYPV